MRTLMRWALVGFVVLPALAGAEDEDEGAPLKLDVPKFEMPALDLPEMDVPKLDGVEAPKAEGPGAPQAPTAVTFTVGDITLAKGFRTGKRGACIARRKIDRFDVDQLPTHIAPFRTCVRLTSTEGVVATVKARIEDPTGREVANAAGEVSFARRGKEIDYLIDWVGFTAKHPGKYILSIQLGEDARGQIELEVKGP